LRRRPSRPLHLKPAIPTEGALPACQYGLNMPDVPRTFAKMAFPENDPEHGFCRDCLTPQRDARPRCERCGSPRLARHGELYSLHVAHIDCDAFYAAVEKRDNPALRDKPLIIGGG